MKISFAFLVSFLLIGLSSCFKGESADYVIHNGKVHVMDLDGKIFDAIAIKDGKILEVGAERQILNKYSADEYIDAQMKDVYPGFTDAHGHIMAYAKQKLGVDLLECRSYDEMLVRLEKYQGKHQREFIIGGGWDQSKWNKTEFPSNEDLNELFPNTPVCLIRVDGHALLANDCLLKKSNVIEEVTNNPEKYVGGYCEYKDGKPTGIIVDNAMNPILEMIPDYPKKEMTQAITQIQNELFGYGITGVHEAGLTRSEVIYLEQLIDKEVLSLDIYGMLLPTDKNIEWAKKNGVYTHENLLIRSFKVFADGGLGSRGAFLKASYSDRHDHFGHLVTNVEKMQEIASICEKIGYQMNTHAIGDSTNRLILEIYESAFGKNTDHRWRIEHAQVISPSDIDLFEKSGVFPSVQPTHAVSDQHWVIDRIGADRLKGAYAYNTLLQKRGMIAIGTDFPIESTDPFRTIHAAINRKNSENKPMGGFLINEKITLDECLRGMTTWASYASFQENQLGTLEKGKDATLVIFTRPIEAHTTYQPNFSYMTFIKGKKVYSVE
ncbi:MAG: amidohydrolase [Crocinitomicaceae bacterium]|nr:amidohydrolase [Crocinitomicaceae bacterium]